MQCAMRTYVEPASPRSFLGHVIAKLWLVRPCSSSVWGFSSWRKQATACSWSGPILWAVKSNNSVSENSGNCGKDKGRYLLLTFMKYKTVRAELRFNTELCITSNNNKSLYCKKTNKQTKKAKQRLPICRLNLHGAVLQMSYFERLKRKSWSEMGYNLDWIHVILEVCKKKKSAGRLTN